VNVVLPTAAILAKGQFKSKHGKTAHGLIRYGRRYKITSVIDDTCAGEDASEILGIAGLNIPIISEVPDGADTLIIGVAPSGGKLPDEWRTDIKKAIEKRMNIVSGLHQFLGDDPEFISMSIQAGIKIIDVRRPPEKLFIASGRRAEIPVVLSMGTDACVGKRTIIMELLDSARKAGYDPGFVATGQTGIMIGCDAGVTADSLPADFISGAVERLIHDVEVSGKDIIFVEGQGSLSHHAYSPSTFGILYGAQPHGIIMVHSPIRKSRSSFPEIPMPTLEDELNLLSAHSKSPVLGIGVNCSDGLRTGNNNDCTDFIKKYHDKFRLPVVDVLASGAGEIFENIQKELLKN
jgi:uncharacterized NAD-dependent epimerase/dehydratase family protein